MGGSQFQAHLSGDIHSAGSLLFYTLSDGVHCFGGNALWQQMNIIKGAPDFSALLVSRSTHTVLPMVIAAFAEQFLRARPT
jgi:hypothetical protein